MGNLWKGFWEIKFPGNMVHVIWRTQKGERDDLTQGLGGPVGGSVVKNLPAV